MILLLRPTRYLCFAMSPFFLLISKLRTRCSRQHFVVIVSQPIAPTAALYGPRLSVMAPNQLYTTNSTAAMVVAADSADGNMDKKSLKGKINRESATR